MTGDAAWRRISPATYRKIATRLPVAERRFDHGHTRGWSLYFKDTVVATWEFLPTGNRVFARVK